MIRASCLSFILFLILDDSSLYSDWSRNPMHIISLYLITVISYAVTVCGLCWEKTGWLYWNKRTSQSVGMWSLNLFCLYLWKNSTVIWKLKRRSNTAYCLPFIRYIFIFISFYFNMNNYNNFLSVTWVVHYFKIL